MTAPQAQLAGVLGVAGSLGAKLTMGDYRPWEAKWALVKHCLEEE